MSNTWDTAGTVWDGAEWQAGKPPAPDFPKEWRWWYQVDGTGPTLIELNPLLVEARWTTDSHTLGDGTYRGDIQPGTITARFWDPGYQLDNLDKNGAMWAYYQPTNTAWCWFYASFSRGLYAPGDPTGADCVYTGTLWPAQLTNARYWNYQPNRPVESAHDRLVWIAGQLDTQTPNMPDIAANIAGQSQLLAVPQTSSIPNQSAPMTTYPGWLQMIRDAAINGVAWLSATGAMTGLGNLTLNYARWETINNRTLDRSQIVAGPPTTADMSYLMTAAGFAATKGDTAAVTYQVNTGNQSTAVGFQGPLTMRLAGDVSMASDPKPAGPELAGASATAQALVTARADPTEQLLDSVDVQSGIHRTPTGGVSPTPWDPYAHTFGPLDVVRIDHGDGTTKQYRVSQTAHRLTATTWWSTHTLDKYSAATPLP